MRFTMHPSIRRRTTPTQGERNHVLTGCHGRLSAMFLFAPTRQSVAGRRANPVSGFYPRRAEFGKSNVTTMGVSVGQNGVGTPYYSEVNLFNMEGSLASPFRTENSSERSVSVLGK